MSFLRPRLAALAALALLVAPAAARAEDLAPRKQALLLLRVLVYDRNLKARAGAAVRVAVAYRAGDGDGERERDDVVAAFEAVSREVVAAGLPVEIAALPYRDPADFDARLAAAHPASVYACASLRGAAKEIARASRAHGALSATGQREAVEAGLAVGLVNRGPRAGVVVNLPAAKAEGADLDAALLAIAEVISRP
ncbi:MAG: YfiR/HmsC family protein [Anaeromyxobacteraceae bacterium]